jgi:hypothetical protein
MGAIAVIGWGSLIWCPGTLRTKSRWHSDGAALPIEFARISADNRLTLVIHPGSPEQTTYWAVSECDSLAEARKNLRMREGTNEKHIHSITSDGQVQGDGEHTVTSTIREWLGGHKEVQAVIWTGLPSNWTEKRGQQFTIEDAVVYLRELEKAKDQAASTYNRAREYLKNAPSQIQTPVRKAIRQVGEWADEKLSANLFD